VSAVAERVAAAIRTRDTAALRALLAPGFVQRSHGGPAVDADAFLRGVERIPGRIAAVHLENLQVDVCGRTAVATGVQHAQVVIDGETIDDRRGFVDLFVSVEGNWLLQAAIDFPASA
jgi:hypothetical protein